MTKMAQNNVIMHAGHLNSVSTFTQKLSHSFGLWWPTFENKFGPPNCSKMSLNVVLMLEGHFGQYQPACHKLGL